LDLRAYYGFAQHWQLAVYARPEARFYTTDFANLRHRRDFNLETGAGIFWSPCKYFQAGASYIWHANYSNYSVLDYQENRPSASLNLTFAF
jgi:hypothetical protein